MKAKTSYTNQKNNSFLVKYLHIVVTIIFYLRDVTLNIFKINRFLSKILTGKAKLGLMTSYILLTILLFPEIMIFHFFVDESNVLIDLIETNLRIVTGKKHPQIKLKRLRKV